MIIILFFIILIGAVNVSSFSIILCKEKIKDKKEHIIIFAAFMIMQALLLAMSSFLLRNFYPIEIEYNFLRTVFIFSSTILLVFTASFVCYCLAVKNGNPNISSFGYTWCVISRIKERKKKQQDRISRSKKLLYALPAVFGIGYMLFFFGITETFFANIQEWLFAYKDILIPAVIATIGFVAVFLLLFLYLLKGKYYNRGIIVCTSVFAGLYLQNAFLNTEKFINGADDTVPHWTLALNILIWVALIAVPQIIYGRIEKSRKYIRNGAVIVAGILLLIQLVPLPYLYASFEKKKPENYGQKVRKENVLSGEDQFTVSSEGNVIVFILDGYQNTNFEYHLSRFPEFKENFKDYIYFDNVATNEMNTVTSMPSLLTASEIDYEVSLLESNKKAWNTGNAEAFYTDMEKAGYSVYLYSDSDDYCGDADNMIGKIANVKQTEYEIQTDSLKTYLGMVRLSLYKYLPISLKDFFKVSGSEEINQYSKKIHDGQDVADSDSFSGMLYTAKERGICMYNFDYYSGLKEGLKVEEGTKRIVFEHMFGMHKPYYGLYGKEEVSNDEEQEVCVEIINEYTRQLKELSLYDDTCIIITADHGFPKIGESDPVMLVKLPNYHGEEMTVNTAPGVLQSDLLPTILDIIGRDPQVIQNGISLLKLSENEQRERRLNYITYDNSLPPVPKCEGIGFSYVNCYEEYLFTGRSEEIDLQKDKVGTKPIFDYWW